MNKLRVVVALMTRDNDLQQAQAQAAEQAAGKLGIETRYVYADNDALTQSQQLLEIIQGPTAARPDAILCHSVGTPLEQVGRAAVRAGIGWVLVNRQIDYLDELRKTPKVPSFCVVADQEEIGHIQAHQLGALLPKGGLVLYIQGASMNFSAQRRTEGMMAAKPDNIEFRMLRGRFTEESGYECVKSWLRLSTSRQANLGMVCSQNDNMALGARRAFLEDDPAHWSYLRYTGCDACGQAGHTHVEKGELAASVLLPPTTGIALEMLAKAIKTGVQPEGLTVLPPQSVPALTRLAPVPAGPAAQQLHHESGLMPPLVEEESTYPFLATFNRSGLSGKPRAT